MTTVKGMIISEQLKTNILSVKDALSLSIRNIAAATGVAEATLRIAMGGRKTINDSWPERFCDAYHVDNVWFLYGTGDPVFTGKSTPVETRNADGASVRLRETRKEMGLKQYEAADILGISRQFLNRLESGNAKPTEQFARRFEDAFGIGAEWLLYGDENKKDYPVCNRMIEYLWRNKTEREKLWKKMKNTGES